MAPTLPPLGTNERSTPTYRWAVSYLLQLTKRDFLVDHAPRRCIMDSSRLENLYIRRLPIYRRAAKRVKISISEMVEDFATDSLFRVAVVKARVKKFASLKRKIESRQIQSEEKALDEIKDIVGIRIVTNNISDVKRICDGIKELGAVSYDEDSLQDYVDSPQDSGYRALHFTIYCTVDHKGVQHTVACEVQVRTLFQDAWGTLTHEDIYKTQQDLPPMILKLSRRLADQLRVLDDIAQDIRDAISEEVASESLPNDATVTKEGLAFVYEEETGKKLLNYEIQQWMLSLDEEGITTLGEAKELLPSQDVQNRMQKVSNDVWGIREVDDIAIDGEPDGSPWLSWGPPVGMMLYYGTKIMAGDNNGYSKFRSAVERDYADTLSVARREAVSALPETVDELIIGIKTGSIDADDLAYTLRVIGGIDECYICGEEILSADDAHEALETHYNVFREELPRLLHEMESSFAMDSADEDMPGLCHHCAHLLTSDHT